MNEWVILLKDKTVIEELERSFVQGPILENGLRSLTEKQISRFGSLKIEIFSNEHPPPHFRVSYQGETANYRISDCSRINGKLDRFQHNVREWHLKNKQLLIQEWDMGRPTNCPVGVYVER